METLDWKALAFAQLEKARVTLNLGDYDRKLLAQQNRGAVFVCNQLLPGLDEWVLTAVLSEYYHQPKILYPYPTPPPKAFRPLVFSPVRNHLTDPLSSIVFASKLAKAVENGEAVGISLDFSDNPLSHLGKNLLRTRILKQLRKAGVTVVPLHINADHLPGGLLRKAIPGLPFQFTAGDTPLNISIRVGNAIPPREIERFERTRPWGTFLQAKIFSLGSPFDVKVEDFTEKNQQGIQPLAAPVDQELMQQEIAALAPAHKIAERGQFDVFIAPFSAIPNVMFEIARLRELTFRAVGEGTGKPRDLDEYDIYYLQLIIWDREAGRIVGGYRLGLGDQIFQRFGVNGFYTHSLFKMNAGFFPVLQESVELGRSYVIPEYQRHRLPLFLLWKGILFFLLANPQYRYLYGPVSISKDYSDASKGVIVEFIRRYFLDKQMSQLVEPRKPFRAKLKTVDTRLLAEHLPEGFEALDNFIETIEPAHFKVPVLFRQYLKLNARFIAFNVDPNFADCLDGLMILDIRNVPESMLEALQQEKT